MDLEKLSEKEVIEIVNKIKPIKKNLEELMSRLKSLEFKMTKILEETYPAYLAPSLMLFSYKTRFRLKLHDNKKDENPIIQIEKVS